MPPVAVAAKLPAMTGYAVRKIISMLPVLLAGVFLPAGPALPVGPPHLTPAVGAQPLAVGAQPLVVSAQPLASAAPALPPAGAAPAYRWPLDGAPRVVRAFDPPPQRWAAGHRGVDLAGLPGGAVRAAGTGVVRFAGRIAGRGVVSVAHEGGLRTTYEPLDPRVRAGDRVFAGDLLGVLVTGHRGCAVPACLHWGLRSGSAYLDPLALLGLGRVRLLPLAGAGGAPAAPVGRSGWPGRSP